MDQPTNQEILEAIQTFSTHVDERFDKLENRVGGLEQDMKVVKATMVTKDYLDERLGSLKGDVTELVRGEDKKFIALVQILRKKNLLDDDDIQTLLKMAPFPQMV